MENRSFTSEASRYKFTGKERDKDIENNYDYFGARYYNSRIANWISIDPLLERNFQWSPYDYVQRNPIRYFDNDGKIQLPTDLISKYPNLASFLQNDLPNVINDKQVMRSLEKHSHLSSEKIREDLQWGNGPTIDVKDLPGAWGHFTKEENSQTLDIKKTLIENFENSTGDEKDILNLFLEVVILHEYTHYGEDQSGVQEFKLDKNNILRPTEEGLEFEKDAFGGMIGGPDMAAKKLNEINEQNGNPKRYSIDEK